jgi:hypothetical protein
MRQEADDIRPFSILSLKSWRVVALNTKIVILLIISFAVLVFAESQSKEQGAMPTVKPQSEMHTRKHAKAKITVQTFEAKPYDQTVGPTLMEIHISERFTGDLEGESTVTSLQLERKDKSGNQVSMQRFTGKLAGRQGSFVLQGSENVENGKIEATWFVVPGSGTGDLSGLRGEGGFEGNFGKGSDGWLDYWFE